MSKKRKHKKQYIRNTEGKANHVIHVTKEKGVFVKLVGNNFFLVDENGVPYDGGPITVVKTYKGQNKERVIAKATGLDYDKFDVLSWLDNYDYIFAIDTNTYPEKIDGLNCSCAIMYYAEVTRIDEINRSYIANPILSIDWYYSSDIKIETLSWKDSIRILMSFIPSNKKVGIVIDSELSNLEKYNNRSLSVYGDWYLPDNYSFIYATANKKDEWCNKLIIQCDKIASARLKQLLEYKRNPDYNYDIPYGNIILYNEATIGVIKRNPQLFGKNIVLQ